MSGRDGGARLPARSVEWGLAGALLVTAAAQHPNKMFDRVRRLDPIGILIPNWRFFAPEPARHDFHVVHRTVGTDGGVTEWRETVPSRRRTWRHALFFPERRRDKALSDVCTEVGVAASRGDVETKAAYRMLREFVRASVVGAAGDDSGPDLEGFQFAVIRYSGYDDSEDPQHVLVSEFVPLA
ncbi:hypothetical protein HWD35_08645 [Tsukamurella tyrosinosolvens]|uniref:Uncharacterized protein n=1 Tax=Tsukamurella tyrosinosolvens TaxID=57704 RepID=A0A1H5AB48_TSUTY|nr:hypothetical protein [Tsukamurella tyrosinosolvens]KXP07375.1 hypothetical protein AXK59_04675 [Tsukamurella tyrosinosolvens]KZL98576.1 hypothetical protein AXX05_06825 [Tsukamurella tyrosinosolvens]MCA4994776.1 hypothetical protein [Tsukamurella tyrosinosolvens]MEC4614718.1 hypothetical protein [Tsukamurella tyrosinosolvens]SED38800.1 hypothetical protein SAMN04489793_4821 [Tsukamurella tyrosinosolvens]